MTHVIVATHVTLLRGRANINLIFVNLARELSSLYGVAKNLLRAITVLSEFGMV